MDFKTWHTDNVSGNIKERLVFIGRGLIGEINGENISGVDIFIQIYDLAAIPADGHAADMVYSPVRVPAGARFAWNYDESDDRFIFNNGLIIVASSTKYTKTTVLADSIDLTVRYKN